MLAPPTGSILTHGSTRLTVQKHVVRCMALLAGLAAAASNAISQTLPPQLIVDATTGSGVFASSGGLTEAAEFDIGVTGVGQASLSGTAIVLVDETISLGIEATGDGVLFLSGAAIARSEDLVVGARGQGHLSVTNNAQLRAEFDVFLGEGPSGVGEGRIDENAELSADGLLIGDEGRASFTVADNARLIARTDLLLGSAATGGGVLNLTGGVIRADDVSIGYQGNGVLNQSGGYLTFTDFVEIAARPGSTGTLNLTGGVAFMEADFFLGGDRNADGGRGILNISGDGDLTLDDELIVRATGQLNLSGGRLEADEIELIDEGTFAFTGGSLRTAAFDGDLVQHGGTLHPAGSSSDLGAMVIGGNYVQAAGTLRFEIAGDAFGQDYHPVFVENLAILQGDLSVAFIDGFRPRSGSRFEVIGADELIGQFQQRSLPDLGGGLALQTILAADEFVEEGLAIVVAGVEGDYNYDGVVDGQDYAVWRELLGSAAGLAADGNGDGAVTNADYLIWKENYGATAEISAAPPIIGRFALAQQSTIPEPCALWLLIIVLAMQLATLRPARIARPRT